MSVAKKERSAADRCSLELATREQTALARKSIEETGAGRSQPWPATKSGRLPNLAAWSSLRLTRSRRSDNLIKASPVAEGMPSSCRDLGGEVGSVAPSGRLNCERAAVGLQGLRSGRCLPQRYAAASVSNPRN